MGRESWLADVGLGTRDSHLGPVVSFVNTSSLWIGFSAELKDAIRVSGSRVSLGLDGSVLTAFSGPV